MKRPAASLIFLVTALAAALPALAETSVAARVPIQLTPQRRQLIGVNFAIVKRRDVTRQIDTTGNVEPDEQLQSNVQTRFAGWIQQVFANQTYQRVSRGQPLFTAQDMQSRAAFTRAPIVGLQGQATTVRGG